MTPADFRAALKSLGLSQRSFAERLGVAPNTVYRWAAGSMAVPKYAELCLSLMQRLEAHEQPER